MKPLPATVAALVAGGKPKLAACLSALETAPEHPDLVGLLEAAWAAPRGLAIGLTGPPGVGKSSLCNALVAAYRRRGTTVAVVAVDPSSRRSGGALLGDRARIEADPEDRGVFIRSMAARRRLGGLADLTFPAVVLLRACFDRVIVETVGVGQSETEIADCADLVVLCIQPGAGDGLQFLKAGVVEAPDVFLVTKSDLGALARRTLADLRGALSVTSGAPPVLVPVSALSGEGIEAAVEAVESRLKVGTDADLIARRTAQGRAWAASRIGESVGSIGLAALQNRLDARQPPFANVSAVIRRVREAVDQAIKNL